MITNTIIIFSFILSLAVLYIFYCQRTIIEYYEPIEEPLHCSKVSIITSLKLCANIKTAST